MAARVPSTMPPTCENGSTSVAASRTIRAQTRAFRSASDERGSNTVQAAPSSGNSAEAQAEDCKTAPSDGDGGREHRAQADIGDEVKGESEPQTRDDDDADFQGRMNRRTNAASAGTAKGRSSRPS